MAAPFLPPSGFGKKAEDLRASYVVAGDPKLTKLSRVEVSEAFAGLNQHFPAATLNVAAAKRPATENQEAMPQLDLQELPDYLLADQRVVVYAEGTGVNPLPSERRFLFDGYPTFSRIRFSGKPGAETQELTVECLSLFEALGRDARPLFGRWMPARQEDRDADGLYPVQFFPALETVFNFDSEAGRYARRGNRHKYLHTVNGIDNVPVFTYDGDPEAQFWTYADALLYLLATYLKPLDLDGQYPLKDGNGAARCHAVLISDTEAAPRQGVARPVEPPETGVLSWADLMLSKCAELPVTGMNLTQALIVLCRQAGINVQQQTRNGGDGNPVSELLFGTYTENGPWEGHEETAEREPLTYAEAVNVPRPMGLGTTGSTGLETGLPEAPVNEAMSGHLLKDHSSQIDDVAVICNAERYEVTVGEGKDLLGGDNAFYGVFKPLWAPDSQFGDGLTASQDIIDKLSEAGMAAADATGDSLTWWERYTTKGTDFLDYNHVGRLWGLDEAGEYATAERAAAMGRANGGTDIWDANAYLYVYDFHEQNAAPHLRDAATGEYTRPWSARRRKVLAPLHLGADGSGLPVLLEVSWDEGGHWYKYPGAFRLAPDQLAVWLTDERLDSEHLACPGDDAEDPAAGKSVYEAILRGWLRLRLTCTVQGDDRAGYVPEAPGKTVVFDLRDAFRVEQSLTAKYATGTYAFTNLNENDQAESIARRYRELGRAPVVSASLHIPWLSKKWLPGDQVSGLQPRGVDFAATVGDETVYPVVVGVRWTSHATDQGTEVMLSDYRTVKRPVR